MHRYCVPLLVLALAGCGGGFDREVLGTWKIDAGTVRTSRLGPGADKSPDWVDATHSLSEVSIRFDKNGSATATGLGATSTAKWKLTGTTLEVTGGETWPDLTFDPRGPRLHAKIDKGGDELTMDFVKSP
jgi:hypothetical protein